MLTLATLAMAITTYVLMNSKNSCNGERTKISLTVDRFKGPVYDLPCATLHGKGRTITPHLGFYEHLITFQDTTWGPSIPLTGFTRFLNRSSRVLYKDFITNFTISFNRSETDFDLGITKRSACLAGSFSFFETNQDSAYGTGDREFVASSPDLDALNYTRPDVIFGLNSYIKETLLHTKAIVQNLSDTLEYRKNIHTNMTLLRNRIIPDVCERGHPGFTNLTRVRVRGGRDVLCDTVTDGGGWIFFQRRVNGIEDFDRDWDDYKKGFGTLNGDFWMGNEWLFNTTHSNSPNTSWEVMTDAMYKGKRIWSVDWPFRVDGEDIQYQMWIGNNIAGNASGLSYTGRWLQWINTNGFTTRDRDNDLYYYNCASAMGGFWYRSCAAIFPNALWGSKKYGLRWYPYTGHTDTLDRIELKIRRVDKPATDDDYRLN